MASAANQFSTLPLHLDTDRFNGPASGVAPSPSGPGSLLERVTDPAALRAAWAHVRRAASLSPSRAVRADARRFEEDADRRLARIAAELAEERFDFGPSRGVAVDR